jgi:hypothetical protein
MAFVQGLGLAPRELAILTHILMGADREGLYWGKCGDGGKYRELGELVALTGYRPQTIRVTARKLRRLGILGWFAIKPNGRYPLRTGYAKKAELGRGKRTDHGGRVWVVPWEKYGAPFTTSPVGMKRAGLIQGDQSRLIPGDQPSDPLISFGDLKNDPAVPPGPTGYPARSRELAPAAADRPRPNESATPAASNGASETRAAAAARPPQSARVPITRDRSAVGGGAGPRGPEAAPMRADGAEIERRRAELAALGLLKR